MGLGTASENAQEGGLMLAQQTGTCQISIIQTKNPGGRTYKRLCQRHPFMEDVDKEKSTTLSQNWGQVDYHLTTKILSDQHWDPDDRDDDINMGYPISYNADGSGWGGNLMGFWDGSGYGDGSMNLDCWNNGAQMGKSFGGGQGDGQNIELFLFEHIDTGDGWGCFIYPNSSP